MRGFLSVFSSIAFLVCAGLSLFAFADFVFGSSRNSAASVVGLCAGIRCMVLSGILLLFTEMFEQLRDLIQKAADISQFLDEHIAEALQ
jgi:hypothetical protein